MRESNGRVTWFTHSKTDVRPSILERDGSVPATVRFTTRPKDGSVFVVRKYRPESEDPVPISTVKTEAEAVEVVYETIAAVTSE